MISGLRELPGPWKKVQKIVTQLEHRCGHHCQVTVRWIKKMDAHSLLLSHQQVEPISLLFESVLALGLVLTN